MGRAKRDLLLKRGGGRRGRKGERMVSPPNLKSKLRPRLLRSASYSSGGANVHASPSRTLGSLVGSSVGL